MSDNANRFGKNRYFCEKLSTSWSGNGFYKLCRNQKYFKKGHHNFTSYDFVYTIRSFTMWNKIYRYYIQILYVLVMNKVWDFYTLSIFFLLFTFWVGKGKLYLNWLRITFVLWTLKLDIKFNFVLNNYIGTFF